MSFLKKNAWTAIVTTVVAILCIFLFCHNHKSEGFYYASLTDIVTIILGTLITIFITERLTDQRRRNDCIEHIIIEIENFVTDDTNFAIDKSTYIKHGSCANRIKYLKDARFKDIEEEKWEISCPNSKF